MKVTSITPNFYSGIQGKNKKSKSSPSFQTKVNVDFHSFMKCKYHGYKLWKLAERIAPKIEKLSDDVEVTLKGYREKLDRWTDYLTVIPDEGVYIQAKYIVEPEKIRNLILEADKKNPFLFEIERKGLHNRKQLYMDFVQLPIKKVTVFKHKNPKVPVTNEEIQLYENEVLKDAKMVVEEMPIRTIHSPLYGG